MTVPGKQEGTAMIPGRRDGAARAKPASSFPKPAAASAAKPQPGLPAASDCRAISKVLSRVGDKWTVLVVETLGGGPKRFNELRRALGSLSQRMLTLTLRALERDGLVSRTVTPTVPPRVDYELTALGHSLLKPVNALADWARAHTAAMDQARTKFDKAQDSSR
jgi:DNA-binding HxlR family transcriptional regulator